MIWSQITVASETWVAENVAKGAADLGRTVQDELPAHARRRAGVDLLEQHRAEEVGTVGRGQEAIFRGVERALIVLVGVVDPDLRPDTDACVVVVVG